VPESNEQIGIPVATDFFVEKVFRIQGEDVIALVLKHLTGQTVGMGLSVREASVLLYRLLDALRSDGKDAQEPRKLHLDRETGQAAAFPVRQISIEVENDLAYLVMETQEGIQIPFSVPLPELGKIASLISVTAIRHSDSEVKGSA
jgi:hypothetical protein